MRRIWLGAHAGADHRPRQYPDRRDRCRGAASARNAAVRGRLRFPPRATVREALRQLDRRNIAGEARPAMLGRTGTHTNFFGGPDTIVDQIKHCRAESGAGVIDLMFQIPGSADLSFLMRSLELFGNKVSQVRRDNCREAYQLYRFF